MTQKVVGFFVVRESSMTPTINQRGKGRVLGARKDPVRLTALLYLQDALQNERYEECAEIIAIALEFGARPVEIRYLLEDPRRTPH